MSASVDDKRHAGTDSDKPPMWKNPWLIGAFVGVVALTILPFMQQLTLRAPPPIAKLGAWSLVDQNNQPIGSEQLKGQVWIASFFFARCPSICPQQQANFKKLLDHVDDLRDDARGPIRLVSFSVDPDNDTPEVLAAYAKKLQAPGGLWSFATGSHAQVEDLLVKHMLVAMGEKRPLQGNPELFDIAHSAKFALIDQNGDLRGFWSTDDLARGNLINAARLLWKRGPEP